MELLEKEHSRLEKLMQTVSASSKTLQELPKSLKARLLSTNERQKLLETRIQRFLQSQFDQTRMGAPISDAERAFEVNTGRMRRWLDRVAGPTVIRLRETMNILQEEEEKAPIHADASLAEALTQSTSDLPKEDEEAIGEQLLYRYILILKYSSASTDDN